MNADRQAEILRNSLLEIRRLRQELEQARGADRVPIAIVGIGLRLPGVDAEIRDLDALWDHLAAGRDSIQEIPQSRFDIDPWYDSNRDAEGKSYVRHAALLEDLAGFDADFFGISPKEARHLDPQQRLLLETAWRALEHAGCPPENLGDTRTGVFVGVAASQYRGGEDVHTITGQDSAFAAGRIAYVFGLRGPTMSVNTTCSSSLVALHLAVRALRGGECDLALAAGANAIVGPVGFVQLSRTQALAADGRSKTFSALADGFGRGEGAVTVALARLDDARAQNRPILAVIRGSALDHDGASSGITAPNGVSQRQVIRAALDNAGLTPADVDAVECHGTGTVLGDPIEVNALAEVYGAGRDGLPPLALTAVKARLGHLEPAAGLAGLAALMAGLRHQALAGNPGAEPLNSHIDWPHLPVSVSLAPTPWPVGERVRRAGLSSFGMSGTNAHVIIEEPPSDLAAEPPTDASDSLASSLPLLLSGQDGAALRVQAACWARELEAMPGSALAAIKRSAALHRSHLRTRATIQASTPEALNAGLGKLATGDPDDTVSIGQARSTAGAVFVFPGHGSQWPGMGAALLDTSPAFAAAIDACDAALAPHTGWSVRAVLGADGEVGQPDLERIDVIQPCLFAMGVALTAVWRDELGVAPIAVVGHSVGEIAAAVVAEALTLEEGARLVALRGRLIAEAGAAADPGAMLAATCPADQIAAYLTSWRERLCVAVINAANACVIAGGCDAIAALEETLIAEGIGCQRVAIGFGAHSPLMEPVLTPLAAGIADLAPQTTAIPFYSPIDGARRDGVSLNDRYWQDNVRATVRFDRAIAALVEDQYHAFIELGGHPVLTQPIAATVGTEAVVVGSLRRGAGGLENLHAGLGKLHCSGVAVDWLRVMGRSPVVNLPAYVFQRRRHWLEQNSNGSTASSNHRVTPQPMLPTATAAKPDTPVTLPSLPPPATPDLSVTRAGAVLAAQLRVFTELTRHQLATATAYAAAATNAPPVADHAGVLGPLATRLSADLARALDGLGNDAERLLEDTAVIHIRAALLQLGLHAEPGQQWTTQQLIAQLGIVPAHHRLARRLCVILAQTGDLRSDGYAWTVLRPFQTTDANAQSERIEEPRMTLLARCGCRLADVLVGCQAPLELLFPNGDARLVQQVYGDTLGAQVFNTLMGQAAASVIAAHSTVAPACVLEIGAGSGGTTATVLPQLSAHQVRYVFTDLGRGFLGAAHNRFQEFPFVEYRQLDIEQTPAEQGFDLGRYDLVLAANVLHATCDLAETVHHAATLLAPGGVLLLLEAVRPLAWVDLTFGLTTGWWRFQDTGLRPDHPLIDAGQWRTLLADCGLADAASIVHPDSEMGIIIAKKP